MELPIELIAKGTFGAIVKIYKDGLHRALKIQLVNSLKENDREFEILRDLQPLNSPCVLKVVGCRRTDDLGKELSYVSRMGRTLEGEDARTFTYQLIEMDLIHGPNLREYLRAHATLGSPLEMNELKGISFQLFWTIFMAQKLIDFKHRDLKPANIMLSDKAPHSFGLESGTWSTNCMVPVPIDFNLSTSSNNVSDKDWRCGTLSYMPPEKMYKIRKCAVEEGYEHDPWSLGIILCSMALCGRSFGKTTPGFNSEETFNPGKTETIYQLWLPNSEKIKACLMPQLPSYEWNTVKHVVILSLFQEAMDNGPFPHRWSEINDVPLCECVKANWNNIKLNLMTVEDHVLVAKCPAILKNIGYDLFALVQGLLKWNPSERISAEQALECRFFAELRTPHVSPTWRDSRDLQCAICRRPASHKCSICKKEYYCSPVCSKRDWATHKHTCKK